MENEIYGISIIVILMSILFIGIAMKKRRVFYFADCKEIDMVFIWMFHYILFAASIAIFIILYLFVMEGFRIVPVTTTTGLIASFLLLAGFVYQKLKHRPYLSKLKFKTYISKFKNFFRKEEFDANNFLLASSIKNNNFSVPSPTENIFSNDEYQFVDYKAEQWRQ